MAADERNPEIVQLDVFGSEQGIVLKKKNVIIRNSTTLLKLKLQKGDNRRQTTVHSRWQSGSKSTARLLGLQPLFPMAIGKKADIQKKEKSP